MPKILVLPGYLQSAKVFAEKSSGIRKLLTKQNYELDYVDPPYVIGHHLQLVFLLAPTPDEADARWAAIVAAGCNRCWWQHDDHGDYVGFADSLQYVLGYIDAHGPFDGIMGFSQGAAMSAVMVNHLASMQLQFKTAILFSGFGFTVPRDPAHDVSWIEDLNEYILKVAVNPKYSQYYDTAAVATQVLNVYGRQDTVVPAVRSKYLGHLYRHVQAFEHDGGHMVPNKKPFLRPLVDAVNEAFGKANL